MKPKIKFESFVELKIHFNRIGVFTADSSIKKRNSAIIKNCDVLCTFAKLFVTTGWFRLFSAQSIYEIAESSCTTLYAILYFMWMTILIWKREKYAAIFDELDDIIEKSE